VAKPEADKARQLGWLGAQLFVASVRYFVSPDRVAKRTLPSVTLGYEDSSSDDGIAGVNHRTETDEEEAQQPADAAAGVASKRASRTSARPHRARPGSVPRLILPPPGVGTVGGEPFEHEKVK